MKVTKLKSFPTHSRLPKHGFLWMGETKTILIGKYKINLISMKVRLHCDLSEPDWATVKFSREGKSLVLRFPLAVYYTHIAPQRNSY